MAISFKTLVVDDDLQACIRLVDILNNFQHVDVIGVCNDGFEAVDTIDKRKPDLIFLEIHIPKLNGFEVINILNHDYSPLIVFISEDDKYGIKAFEVNAFDYLIKPYEVDRIEHTLNAAKKRKRIGEN